MKLFLILLITLNGCNIYSQTLFDFQPEKKFAIGIIPLGVNENFSDIPSKEFFSSLKNNLMSSLFVRYKLPIINKDNTCKMWQGSFFLRAGFSVANQKNEGASLTEELAKIDAIKFKSTSRISSVFLEYHLRRNFNFNKKIPFLFFSPYLYAGVTQTSSKPTVQFADSKNIELSILKTSLVFTHVGVGVKLLRFGNYEIGLEEGCRFSGIKNVSGVVYKDIPVRKDFFYNGSLFLVYKFNN